MLGSISGGTKVTITGSGFIPRSTYVRIGQNNYYNNDALNTNITYTQIVLTTSANSNGTNLIVVNSNSVQAVCLTDCTFSYSQSITPKLSTVAPNSVNTSSLITITGTSFGSDLNSVNIQIGSQNCVASTVTDQAITCNLAGLNLGNQNVAVNIIGENEF